MKDGYVNAMRWVGLEVPEAAAIERLLCHKIRIRTRMVAAAPKRISRRTMRGLTSRSWLRGCRRKQFQADTGYPARRSRYDRGDDRERVRWRWRQSPRPRPRSGSESSARTI